VANDKKVEVIITADASGVAKGVAVANTALGNLKTQLTSLDAAAAKAFSFSGLTAITVSATAAAAALVGAVKSAADYGDQLDNMSQRTGVAVEELAKLQYAAKLSDTSSEALGKGIGNLSKLMVAAAGGAEESSKLFEKFGINLRNADGTIRGTSDVLYDLADVFATMPEGPQKTAMAMDFFGKKLGQELIPLLNQGGAGLRAMGDEAERLGLVLNSAQAKAAADFNDNLDRLGQLSKSVAVSIGNALIPALNNMMVEMGKAKDSSDGFLVSFLKFPFGLSQFQKARDAAANIETLTKRIDALREKINAGKSDSIYGFDDGNKATLEKLIAERAELQKLQGKQQVDEDSETAAKRLAISTQLAREQANLENLKAIAAGKASADILKTDKERSAEQLKDAEKLRGALQTAWETSRKEALKAGEDAQKLFEKAANVRASAADKATDLRNADLPEEDKRALALGQAQDLQGQGNFYAAAAGAAKLDGRAADFEKYQKQAETFLDRAMKFAEAAGDADTVEAVGKAQAGVIDNNAKAKQGEAAALEAQAAAQAGTIAKLDTDIEALKTKAANIEIKANIAQAEGAVAGLQQKLDALKDKTVTVTVNTVGSPAAMAAAAAAVKDLGSDAQGLAYGGQLAGSAPHDRADNRLFWGTPGEWVIQRPAARYYGAAFMAALNAMRLPKFALGGQIGGSAIDRLRVPALTPVPSPRGPGVGSGNLTLDFGELGKVTAQAGNNTQREIERVFTRAALARGRR